MPQKNTLAKKQSKAAKKAVGTLPSAKKKMSIGSLLKNLQANSVQITQGFARPPFSKAKQTAARLEATLATGIDYSNRDLTQDDLAAPHRAPYARIRDVITSQPEPAVTQMVQTLCGASSHCEAAFKTIGNSSSSSASSYQQLAKLYESTRKSVESKLTTYQHALQSTNPNPLSIIRSKLSLIQAVNNLASNAPGLGPHSTANAIVSDRLHPHPTDNPNEPQTPRTVAALGAFPSEPVATTTQNQQAGRQVVSVTGAGHTLALGSKTVENINVGDRVLRGALFVDHKGNVFRPKNPQAHPKGNFQNDWELVT